MHDLQPAGIARGNILQSGNRALVMLDRDHARGAEREQRAGQPARAGADLDDGGILERGGGARNPCRQIEIEQKILAERFAGRQRVGANDLAQWREVVDRAHAGCDDAMRLASRKAAIRLAGFALPVPAMSNAVP
jgi:hypothetical protein